MCMHAAHFERRLWGGGCRSLTGCGRRCLLLRRLVGAAAAVHLVAAAAARPAPQNVEFNLAPDVGIQPIPNCKLATSSKNTASAVLPQIKQKAILHRGNPAPLHGPGRRDAQSDSHAGHWPRVVQDALHSIASTYFLPVAMFNIAGACRDTWVGVCARRKGAGGLKDIPGGRRCP